MIRFQTSQTAIIASLCVIVASLAVAGEQEWDCTVLPPEHDISVDPVSGAKTVFVTTDAASDRNLYFHENSWLADESLLVFISDRTGRDELFGYLEATGELVRLGQDEQQRLAGVTCSSYANRVYGVRSGEVIAVDIRVEPASGTTPTRVRATQRIIARLPANGGLRGSLNENSTGEMLSLAYNDLDDAETNHIVAIEVASGRVVPVATVTYPVSHVQFSWTRPDMIMFSRAYPEGDRMDLEKPRDGPPNHRMWHVDFSGRAPWPIIDQVPGELATHECWWTEDRLTFCGGHHPHQSHLKVYDVATGRTSILGACGWWPEGTAEQITRRAWWHAAGAPDGSCVAADTFHGGISIFAAKTGEERPLTAGHRVFGSGGAHPHVGWAPSSDRVVFASNKRGQVDVVVCHVPEDWR